MSKSNPKSGEVREGVESLLERGFCVVEGSLSEEDRKLAADVLDGLILSGGARDVGNGWVIHPLCTRDARINALFCDPTVLGIMAALFEDEVRLMHSGSRVTDACHTTRLGWHSHPFTKEESETAFGDPRRGTRPQRVLCNWYVDGSTEESGPLLAYPRRFDDPVAPPFPDRNASWPGEAAVVCPPGSAVIFSIDLWHAALPGTAGGRRRLFGGHFQGRNNSRPHREDQVQEGAVIEESIRRSPVFAGLLRGKPLAADERE
jgi:hypothetical protein